MAVFGWKPLLALLLGLLQYAATQEHRVHSLENSKHVDYFKAHLSEEGRTREEREGEEQPEEEEEDEDESLAGYTSGCATVGGFSLVMAIFYLINNPRTVVRRIIWQVVSNTINIFCAVFIFQTGDRLLRLIADPFIGMASLTNDLKFEALRYLNQGQVCFWYGCMFIFMSLSAGVGMGMWFRLSMFKDKLSFIQDKNYVRMCGLFAHVCAFTAMEGWGSVQTSEFRDYRKSVQASLKPLVECYGKWMFILIVLGVVRRKFKYNFIEFWKADTTAVLHYSPGDARYDKYHGKEVKLLDYDKPNRQFRVSVDVDGRRSEKKVNLEHIGVSATVTSDATKVAGPDIHTLVDGVSTVGKKTVEAMRAVGSLKKAGVKDAAHKLGDASESLVNMLRPKKRLSLAERAEFEAEEKRLFDQEAGAVVRHSQIQDAGRRHWVFAGAQVVDNDGIRQDDKVVVLCTHHYSAQRGERYGMHLAVVQRQDPNLQGKNDPEWCSRQSPKNVAWSRLKLENGDPFREGPFADVDPMVDFWEEQLEEGENDIVALSVSFLLVQSLRFWIGGHLPDEMGTERKETLFKKSWGQVWGLYGMAILLAAWAYGLHPWLLKEFKFFHLIRGLRKKFRGERLELQKKGQPVGLWMHLREEPFYVALRAVEILGDTLVFAMCWCFMYGTLWALASEERPVLGNRFLLGIWQAIAVTLAVFVMLALLDPMISRQIRTDPKNADRVERSLVKFCASLGFLIGFSWEKAFDAAVEEIAETLSKDKNQQAVILVILGLFSLAVLMPAWSKFILPMVDEKAYTLGFHSQRIVTNCKHGFDKSARAQEQKYKRKLEEEMAEKDGQELPKHKSAEERALEEMKENADVHTHEVRRLAKSYQTSMKLLGQSFVIRTKQPLRPRPEQLQKKDEYVQKLVAQARESLHDAEYMIEHKPHRKELRQIVDCLAAEKATKARYEFKFKFDACATQEPQDNSDVPSFQRQASAASECSSDQDDEESAYSESSLEEEDEYAKYDSKTRATLMRSAELRKEHEDVHERAKKCLNAYSELAEEVENLKVAVTPRVIHRDV